MSQQKIYLVGAGIEGWEGFGAKALEVINSADLLIGHQRHLDIFPDFAGKKQTYGDLSIMLEFLKDTDQRVVVLSSGDPNFFGIARFLLRNLPKERIEIFPNVTSVQYAFARIREPWDDAIFLSVHGRGLKSAIDRIIAADKAAVLTDAVNNPAAIARELIARGAEGYGGVSLRRPGPSHGKIHAHRCEGFGRNGVFGPQHPDPHQILGTQSGKLSHHRHRR